MATRTPSGPPRVEGVRPDPSTLPRPKLFSAPAPGHQAGGYTVAADLQPHTPGQTVKLALVAVGLMIAATILFALAVVFWRWPYAAGGGAIGAVGVILGWRARIMEDAREGESPEATY